MKITPLEIRQRTFERALRGYNKDEVSAFLLTLSQEWERMQDEMKELRIKLNSSEHEVSKLRQVEDSLYKTLKTAEDTSTKVIDQANKQGELYLKETHLKAESILNEATSKARSAIELSETTSKQMLSEMESQLKELIQNYKNVEALREGLIGDLKRVADEILDKVERVKQVSNDFDLTQHLNTARKEGKKALHHLEDSEALSAPEESTPKPSAEKQDVKEQDQSSQSFFDEIQ